MPADLPTDAAAVSSRIDDLLARAGARDRANIEKHLTACDAETDKEHGKLWRRLVSSLWGMAPMPVTMVGSQAMQFFIADGKFRMQVFALEDRSDGVISLYLPDVMHIAIKDKTVIKAGEEYVFGSGSKKIAIPVQQMDAANTFDPPAHMKNLIGWNRKAIKLTLDATKSDGPQIAAAEALCAIAAKNWAAVAAK
jgi:hypothetical protein